MNAYVITTGIVFGLITVAHIWRVVVEGLRPAMNPWFVLTTILAAVLCGWAWRLFRALPRS